MSACCSWQRVLRCMMRSSSRTAASRTASSVRHLCPQPRGECYSHHLRPLSDAWIRLLRKEWGFKDLKLWRECKLNQHSLTGFGAWLWTRDKVLLDCPPYKSGHWPLLKSASRKKFLFKTLPMTIYSTTNLTAERHLHSDFQPTQNTRNLLSQSTVSGQGINNKLNMADLLIK